MKKLCVSVILFLLMAAMAHAGAECPSGATCFYIDADAAAGGNGSEATPWDDVSDLEVAGNITAIEAAASGGADTYIFMDRRDTFTVNTTSNNRQYFAFNGTASHWVTVDGMTWGGASAGKSKILFTVETDNCGLRIQNGTVSTAGADAEWNAYMVVKGLEVYSANVITNTAIVHAFNTSYLTVEDCVIHGTKNSGTHAYGLRAGSVADTTAQTFNNIIFRRNVVYDIASAGISLYSNDNTDQFDNCEISDNIVYDFGKYFAAGAGIFCASTTNSTVTGNEVYNGSGTSDGYGIKIEDRAGGQPSAIVVDKNLIYGGTGIELMHGICFQGSINCVARNNILYNLSGYGFRSYTSDVDATHTTGSVVEANTFYEIANNTIHLNASNVIASLKNNISAKTNDSKFVYAAGTITAHNNNVIYNNTSSRTAYDNGGGTTYTYAQIVGSWEATAQVAAPGFVDTGSLPTAVGVASGLAIGNGGSAYHNGADLSGSFTADFEGKTRVSPWDIGAFEYQDAVQTEFYVDATGGNDSNPGTQAEPWQTLVKVNEVAYSPGDTIYLKRGETWAWAIMPQASGTSGSPITYTAYGTGANPLVVLPSGYGISGLFVDGKNYLVFDGVDFGNGTVATGDSAGVVIVNSCTGIVLKNCTVAPGGYQASGLGTIAVASSAAAAVVTIENVTVDNSRWDGISIAGDPRVTMTGVVVDGWRRGYGVRVAGSAQVTATDCIVRDGSRDSQPDVWPTGWVFSETSVGSLTRCSALNCPEDGFDSSGTSVVTLTDCVATGNGDGGNASCGDGATAHNGSAMTLVRCNLSDNYRDGIGIGNSGGGSMTDCVLTGNGSYGVYIPGGLSESGVWTISRCRFRDTGTAVHVASGAITSGLSIASSHNVFCSPATFLHNDVALAFGPWVTAVGDVGSVAAPCNQWGEPAWKSAPWGNERMKWGTP